MGQLADTMFYQEQTLDLTTSFNALISNTLKEIQEKGEIDMEVLTMLLTEQERTSELYLLPKIHKCKNPMSGEAGCVWQWQPNREDFRFH